MALQLTIAVLNGGYSLFDKKQPCSQGKVAYFALEDDPRRIKERLAIMENADGLNYQLDQCLGKVSARVNPPLF